MDPRSEPVVNRKSVEAPSMRRMFSEQPSEAEALLARYYAVYSRHSEIPADEMYGEGTHGEWLQSDGTTWDNVPILRKGEIVGGFHCSMKIFDGECAVLVEQVWTDARMSGTGRSEVVALVEGAIDAYAEERGASMTVRELRISELANAPSGYGIVKFHYIQLPLEAGRNEVRDELCIGVRSYEDRVGFPVEELLERYCADFYEGAIDHPAIDEMRRELDGQVCMPMISPADYLRWLGRAHDLSDVMGPSDGSR